MAVGQKFSVISVKHVNSFLYEFIYAIFPNLLPLLCVTACAVLVKSVRSWVVHFIFRCEHSGRCRIFWNGCQKSQSPRLLEYSHRCIEALHRPTPVLRQPQCSMVQMYQVAIFPNKRFPMLQIIYVVIKSWR